MNECIRRAKKRRAHRKRQTKAEANLFDRAAEKHSEMLNPRRLSVLREVGAVMLQQGEWIACRQELFARFHFIYTNGLTENKEGTLTWICCQDDGLMFSCACKNNSNYSFRCTTRTKKTHTRVTLF